MRKHQTLLVAGILLLASTAVAQAQGVYEVFSNPVMARTGGAREMAGDVVLFLRTGVHAGGVVTVRFSAPLAEGLAGGEGGVTATRANGTPPTPVVDLDEGTVTITMPEMGDESITLSGVRLDVREAEAPVTAMFSGDSNAFLSGAANVISEIRDALEVKSTPAQILTRGGMASTTVELKEAFAGAFTVGAEVKLTLVGVPDKTRLTVSHAGIPTQAEVDADTDLDDTSSKMAAVAGNVTLNDTMIVNGGNIVDTNLMMTGDGDKLNITVSFGDPNDAAIVPNPASTESLNLMFTLEATSAQKDLMLPLDEGKVEVWVTMAPTEKPGMIDAGTEYFALNYMPADGVVAFTIAPASCTLLFPYAAFAQGWNTGIAIANPSAFTTPLSGSITFTLFSNDEDMVEYSTDGMSSGVGLDPDGSIPAGNTYTVLLSQILEKAGFSGDFIGHFYVKTDFTGCRGMAYVTDFQSGAQAYLPYFGDNLDEGDVPSNTSKK